MRSSRVRIQDEITKPSQLGEALNAHRIPALRKSGSTARDVARVLLFSPRNLKHECWRSYNFEFEDAVADLDDVALIAPNYRVASRPVRAVRDRLKRWFGATFTARAVPEPVRLGRTYDLFFTVMVGLPDLDALEAIPGWRRRCGTAVCWIDEIWLRQLREKPGYRVKMRQLAAFDRIFLACRGTVPELSEILDRPCEYMAPAIDALAFCPHPHPPVRSIDVLSLGRRCEATHQALFAAAAQRRIHYVYDTAPMRDVFSNHEHRALLSNMLQRSRYFLVNPAKVDRPGERKDQEELGYRFFEGAAAGAVLLGQAPNGTSFAENFDWPDAVVRMPYGSTEFVPLIETLDADPARTARIRRDNVVNCLRRHDWLYRWESILGRVGLESRGRVAERRERLRLVADELALAPCL